MFGVISSGHMTFTAITSLLLVFVRTDGAALLTVGSQGVLGQLAVQADSPASNVVLLASNEVQRCPHERDREEGV